MRLIIVAFCSLLGLPTFADSMWETVITTHSKVLSCKEVKFSFISKSAQTEFCRHFQTCEVVEKTAEDRTRFWVAFTDRGDHDFYEARKVCEKAIQLFHDGIAGKKPKAGFAPIPLAQPPPSL